MPTASIACWWQWKVRSYAFNAHHASTAGGGGAPQGRKGKYAVEPLVQRITYLSSWKTPIGPDGPLPPARGKHLRFLGLKNLSETTSP